MDTKEATKIEQRGCGSQAEAGPDDRGPCWSGVRGQGEDRIVHSRASWRETCRNPDEDLSGKLANFQEDSNRDNLASGL